MVKENHISARPEKWEGIGHQVQKKVFQAEERASKLMIPSWTMIYLNKDWQEVCEPGKIKAEVCDSGRNKFGEFQTQSKAFEAEMYFKRIKSADYMSLESTLSKMITRR